MIFQCFQDYIKGFVEFSARGGFPERFINLCSSNNIEIKNVRMYKETISATCNIKAYRKIRHTAKKAGMRVRLIKKHGLPFLIYKKRKRIGVIPGLAFLVAMTYFLSGYIWTIKVNGNENIPDEEIIPIFESLGVKTGIRKGDINTKDIARKALTETDKLMWAAVNADACKITIEVKERVAGETETEDKTPSNIIAAESGQIILIENFLGTPLAEVGSAVEKGDIIVSGAVINKDESVNFYNAQANVYARTKKIHTTFIPATCKMRVYEKLRKKYFISFFGVTFCISLPVKSDGEYTFSSGEDFLKSGKDKLPAGIITERYAFYELKNVKPDENCARLLCAEKHFRETDRMLDEAEIEKSTTKMQKDKTGYTIESVFECVENIGENKKMDIILENNENGAY